MKKINLIRVLAGLVIGIFLNQTIQAQSSPGGTSQSKSTLIGKCLAGIMAKAKSEPLSSSDKNFMQRYDAKMRDIGSRIDKCIESKQGSGQQCMQMIQPKSDAEMMLGWQSEMAYLRNSSQDPNKISNIGTSMLVNCGSLNEYAGK